MWRDVGSRRRGAGDEETVPGRGEALDANEDFGTRTERGKMGKKDGVEERF